MSQICNCRAQGRRAGKWQERSCLAVSIGRLGGQSTMQVFSSIQRLGEAEVLGWVPRVKCMLMPKAGLAHEGQGWRTRIRVSSL